MTSASPTVSLRPVTHADLPHIYRFNQDAEGCALAAVIPRSQDAFTAHWTRVLADPTCTALAILADGELAGSIGCFKADGQDCIGYWLDREQWGRGIASRAIALLLERVPTRPLHAQVASHNAASIRVLQKSGFTITGTRYAPATERYLACDEVLLILPK